MIQCFPCVTLARYKLICVEKLDTELQRGEGGRGARGGREGGREGGRKGGRCCEYLF